MNPTLTEMNAVRKIRSSTKTALATLPAMSAIRAGPPS